VDGRSREGRIQCRGHAILGAAARLRLCCDVTPRGTRGGWGAVGVLRWSGMGAACIHDGGGASDGGVDSEGLQSGTMVGARVVCRSRMS
jgi:hypothetical protein